MIPDRIQSLYQKCLTDTASPEERQVFAEWMTLPENEGPAKDLIAAAILENGADAAFDSKTGDEMMQAIFFADEQKRAIAPVHRVHFLRKWGWVAAGVVALLGVAAVLRINGKKDITPAVEVAVTKEIGPGKDGAVLTLADGTQIVLDSLGNQLVATQNGSKASIKNGELVYDAMGESPENPGFNTMTTPKGKQFSVQLPDGTRVWLNAASSIRYPTAFKGNERAVQITGEVYFEVTKHSKMPFRVQVNDRSEVEVLGTSFNVNAYENENYISTTLLEGAVKMNGTLMRPGQQAKQMNADNKVSVINNADTDKVMAWKNGFFNFDNMSLEEAMRQLSRWYDIDVVYAQGIPKVKMAGEMKRDLNLSQLLEALKELGLHYQIEGRKLIVKQ
ncbi:MAG: FecR family protein [Pseudobacter sp.]|uniref:FecR family protein n=1 Tax=Pseudobacter sp. TaxID=2045420 RepID=UPI003F7E0FA2